MPLKMETKKPLSKDKRCPFQFVFKWESESDCWSLNGSTGCVHHEYHFCNSSLACRVVKLPDKIKQEIAKYADRRTANLTMTHMILAFKSNIELKGDQVQNLQTKLGRSASENSDKGISAEQLLAYLDSHNNISYLLCLFDKVE
jgi:hypothetical protein